MGYIGQEPSVGGYELLTISGTINGSNTSFTLNKAPATANHLMVIINGVLQIWGTGYTVSGTTLTTTSAPATGSVMACLMLGSVYDVGKPTDGTVGTASIANSAITNALMAANSIDSDQYVDGSIDSVHLANDAVTATQLDLTDNYTFTGQLVGARLTPAFHAYLYNQVTGFANQTVTVIPMAHERFDTDSAYDTSTYKFTPQVAGTYMFGVAANMQLGDGKVFYVYVLKNSQVNSAASWVRVTQTFGSQDYAGAHCTGPIVMNGSTDYVSPCFYHNHGSDVTLQNHYDATYFWGFRLY